MAALRLIYPELPKDADTTSDRFLRAQTALRNLRSIFQTNSLEYERTLGFGGFGLAAKYSQKDSKGQHFRHVVIKAPLTNDPSKLESVQEEFKWYQRMKGMEHVPYLVDPLPMWSLPPAGSKEPATRLRGYEFEKYKERYLITEYLEHGELASLLERLNVLDEEAAARGRPEQKTYIPNRLLWRFLLCRIVVNVVTRACLAMANPDAVRQWREGELKEDPTITNEMLDNALREVPYREKFEANPENVVHFDIDPFNVFLGQVYDPDGEDREHKYFKAVLGDFGLAEQFPPNMDRRILARYAGRGKSSWHAPEQFLGIPPSMETWTYKTNLWGIGLVMCSLMTKARLSSDPIMKLCRDAVFTYPDGEQITVPRTYGYFLENPNVPDDGEYQQYDADLRYTVATLMASELDIRGTLDLLLITVEGAIREGNEKAASGDLQPWETDDALQEFIDTHLKNAPVVPFPAGAALEAPPAQTAQANNGLRPNNNGVALPDLDFLFPKP